jgi:hypothetical protein
MFYLMPDSYIFWTLRNVGKKYLETFEMWCCRRMEKFSWTDRVRIGEILQRVKEERNFVHKIKRMKANSIGLIWRGNCRLNTLLKERDRRRNIIDGKTRKKT